MMIVLHIQESPFSNSSEGIANAQEDKSTPRLEALVRESLQNSLDATDGPDDVIVEYGYREYDIEKLSSFFPDLSSILKPQPKFCLYVKDRGTTGLTGDIVDKGANYYGLVKKIGQSGKDAGSLGGSWGKGKSVFYRQGIGLVIFYSRIRIRAGLFESRMNAVFADWRELFKYSPINNWTGISIWGGEKFNGNDVTPVYDDGIINEVLRCFNIPPYTGDDTGTTVIMPAVSERDLRMDAEDGTEHDADKTWLTSVERCIDFYIQKWFSPRLNNPVEGKPTLRCMVNNKQVVVYHNLFKRFQKLYNDTFDLTKKNVEYLPLRNQNRSYGNLAWEICTDDDLKDHVPYCPYKLCGIRTVSEKGNHPIVTYVRSPGMFLTFEEPRLANLPETETGSHLIAVFRLNPDSNTLVTLKNEEKMSLEKYVRSTEKSDHMGWKDTSASSDNFIANIMNQIHKKLSNQLRTDNVAKVSGRRSTDGRFVADKLFPEGGSYLHARRNGDAVRAKARGHRIGKRSDVRFWCTSQTQNTDGVLVSGILQFVNARTARIRLGAYAESVTYYSDDWEKDIGSQFPISFFHLSVLSYGKEDGTETVCSIRTAPENPKANGDRFIVRWLSHSEVQINSERMNIQMKIELLIRRPDGMTVVPTLSFSIKGEDDE